MKAKLSAYLMLAVTLMYCVLLGQKSVLLVLTGTPIAVAMGILLLVFPIVAIAVSIREFIFGTKVERLGSKIEAAGQWPLFQLEIRASGRPTKASALAEFEVRKAAVEQSPDDYLAWFALGLAYDASGDRRRAREAMRKAIALEATN